MISKVLDRESDSLEIFSNHVFHFSKQGTLHKADFISPRSHRIIISSYYDQWGRIYLQKRSDDYWRRYVKYLYNDKQHLSTKISYNSDSVIVQKISVRYDSLNKKPILKKRFRDNNTLADSTVYQYNTHNDLVFKFFYNTPNGYGIHLDSTITGGKERFDPWSDDTTRFVYAYNSEGTMIRKTKYLMGDPYRKFIFYSRADTAFTITKGYDNFDKKWILKEISKKIDDKEIRLIYLHDSYSDDIKQILHHGRIVSLIRFKNQKITDKTHFSYKFEFNEHGQWVKMYKYREDQLIKIKTRSFTYW